MPNRYRAPFALMHIALNQAAELCGARAAREADAGIARGMNDIARFYAAHILPRAQAHEAIVTDAAAAVTQASPADL